jgi:chorismate dehydratase
VEEKLRIGKISFANLYPVFRMLEGDLGREGYEIVQGYPSALNRMLRQGSLDVSPSSSIEYLRHEDMYSYIQGHSISSKGPVGSILLFSRKPIESLGGEEVFTTHQSETSAALLKVILGKFYSLACAFKTTEEPFEKAVASHAAYLSIGDEALRASRKAGQDTGAAPRRGKIGGGVYYIYDLGDLWHRNTALPVTFALWIVRKDLPEGKKRLFEKFRADLERTGLLMQERFDDMAREPGLVLPPPEMAEYWRGIYYGLDEECLRGLELLRRYLLELNLL